MHKEGTSANAYALQRTPEEMQRLLIQSQVINPSTRRMLEMAGITTGMRVLDIGSGAGDVALLLAEQVGPAGSIVGVDIDPSLLSFASERATAAGYTNISFQAGDITKMEFAEEAFDAIVGRLIMLHLPTPTATLQRLSTFLRPGGIVAFQDFDMAHFAAMPVHPPNQLQQWVCSLIAQAFSRAGISIRTGLDLYRIFRDAGLPAPHMHGEASLLTGEHKIGYEWGAETLRSLLPLVLRFGLASEEEVDINTLADRMHAEAVSQRLVMRGPDVIAAWTRKA